MIVPVMMSMADLIKWNNLHFPLIDTKNHWHNRCHRRLSQLLGSILMNMTMVTIMMMMCVRHGSWPLARKNTHTHWMNRIVFYLNFIIKKRNNASTFSLKRKVWNEKWLLRKCATMGGIDLNNNEMDRFPHYVPNLDQSFFDSETDQMVYGMCIFHYISFRFIRIAVPNINLWNSNW